MESSSDRTFFKCIFYYESINTEIMLNNMIIAALYNMYPSICLKSQSLASTKVTGAIPLSVCVCVRVCVCVCACVSVCVCVL